jgi:hypothetical protein
MHPSTVFLAAAFALATTAAHAESKCYTPGFVSLLNQTVTAHMTAESGKACGIRLASTDGTVTGTSIAAAPKFGRASTASTRVIYTSKPGYVGRDVFTYRRDLIDRYGAPARKLVIVEVDVVR